MATAKLDQDARYSVKGWKGIAFRFDGFPKRWEPYTSLVSCEDMWCSCNHGGDLHEVDTGEGEWVEQDSSCGRVVVVMVGDDKRHEVDAADLTALADGEFCGGCGQIGCAWGAC